MVHEDISIRSVVSNGRAHLHDTDSTVNHHLNPTIPPPVSALTSTVTTGEGEEDVVLPDSITSTSNFRVSSDHPASGVPQIHDPVTYETALTALTKALNTVQEPLTLHQGPSSISGNNNGGFMGTNESNLSLRAMFIHDDDATNHDPMNDHIDPSNPYDESSNARSSSYLERLNDDVDPIHQTPPHSLTPNTVLSKKQFESQSTLPQYVEPPSDASTSDRGTETLALESLASSATSDASLTGGGRHNRQPSIYSAIGSLEDPLTSSYKGWKSGSNKRGAGIRNSNFDFPSSTLLAPTSHALGKKNRNMLEASVSSNERLRGYEMERHTSHQADQQQNVSSNTKKQVSGVLKSTNQSVNNDEKQKSIETLKQSSRGEKKVSIDQNDTTKAKVRKSSRKQHAAPAEMFRPSSDAYTPRMGKKEIKYKPAAMRTSVHQMASPLGTLSRPNFRDALRRVAMIIHQHIVKIERRFEHQETIAGHHLQGRVPDDGLFSTSMKDAFSEDRYSIPRYKCTMVRVPMARAGMVYGLKQIRECYAIPSEGEIYEFAHQLFKAVQLSSECSIVGLIYVERLMEAAKVPLLAETWRPIFMCGLLMASKVWQDLSSWNIEFANVYPRYSLESINRLELQFLRMIKWDLYISSSQYAKYYFALRSLVEKTDFRQRYNRMVGGVDMVQASQARKIEERSTMVKEEAILHLSHSM
jgi:Cyclin